MTVGSTTAAIMRRFQGGSSWIRHGQCSRHWKCRPRREGDKEKPHLTDEFNADHVTDLVEIEGDELQGVDVCWEFKVAGPLNKTQTRGRGSWEKGGRSDTVT